MGRRRGNSNEAELRRTFSRSALGRNFRRVSRNYLADVRLGGRGRLLPVIAVMSAHWSGRVAAIGVRIIPAPRAKNGHETASRLLARCKEAAIGAVLAKECGERRQQRKSDGPLFSAESLTASAPDHGFGGFHKEGHE